MPQRPPHKLEFPAGGLNRRAAYQAHSPYSSPDCLNVRPESYPERRLQGGSRPGLSRAFQQQLGEDDGGGVLISISIEPEYAELGIGDPLQYTVTGHYAESQDEDLTRGDTGTVYRSSNTSVALISADGLLTAVGWGTATITAQNSGYEVEAVVLVSGDGSRRFGSRGGAEKTELQGASGSGGSREIGASSSGGQPIRALVPWREILPAGGGFWQDTFNYEGHGRLVDLNPVWSRVNFSSYGGRYYTDLLWVSFDRVRNIYYDYGAAVRGELRIDTTQEYSFELSVVENGLGGSIQIFAQLDADDPNVFRNGLLADISIASGGPLFMGLQVFSGGSLVRTVVEPHVYTSTTGRMRLTISPGKAVLEWFADRDYFRLELLHDPPPGRRFGIAVGRLEQDAVNTFLDNFVVRYNEESGAAYNRSRLFAIAGKKIYKENDLGDMVEVGNAGWNMGKGRGFGVDFMGKVYFTTGGEAVGVYEPDLGAVQRLYPRHQGGTVPTYCQLIGVYRDSLVLAGDRNAPHQYYLSAMGDATDWNFGSPNPQGAFTSVNSDAGRVPHPITAFIPGGDDYAIFGTRTSLWLMRGDPRFGGQVDNISRTIGPVDGGAWCHLPDGGIVMLTLSGLYLLYPGGEPRPLSEGVLPSDLRDIDPADTMVSMAYDHQDRGIHIFCSSVTGSVGRHYWFSLDRTEDGVRGGFYPVSFDRDFDPFAAVFDDSDVIDKRKVILGGRDGYLRLFKQGMATDDGLPFSNYVTIGPIRLGQDESAEGVLMELIPTLGQQSGDVRWEIFMGRTPEEAVRRSQLNHPDDTGIWSAGLGYTENPVLAGQSFVLKLRGIEGRSWAMEHVMFTRQPLGRNLLP